MPQTSFTQLFNETPASWAPGTAGEKITARALSWETDSLLYLCPSVYHLLTRLYQGPLEEAFLRGLKESHIFTMDFPVYCWPDLEAGLKAMLQDLERPGEEIGLLAKELRAEYRWLFSRFHQAQAPPMESFFLSVARENKQVIALELRKKYLQAGMLTIGGGARPDDHLCLELGFMASLSQHSANALEVDNQELLKNWLLLQKAFLEEHLLKWIPQFAKQVQLTAKTRFYQGLARFTHAFVRFHLALLQGLSMEAGRARVA